MAGANRADVILVPTFRADDESTWYDSLDPYYEVAQPVISSTSWARDTEAVATLDGRRTPLHFRWRTS